MPTGGGWEDKAYSDLRNPIFLAREWAEAMEAGNFRSQRAFAKASGLSHARVSQVLGLLRLCPSARDALDALGDPLYSRKVTERKLRPIVNLSEAEQVQRLKLLLRAYVIYKKQPAS